ncbi:Protein sey1 [Coniochaeta pulveracea]|uniref:Protein sey1 n=1 Tax=Coniochaeta pulveracea TaxID=177199 RepID=A0A420Y4Y5_9PEZI|nr:Protein sey1 [Coniochaeta pulveracea]
MSALCEAIGTLSEKLTLLCRSPTRSLLFFVIRDHIGVTPLANLRNTLVQDLGRIWSSISKPQGLENSKIEDYFDFAFAALPHKVLQPEKFVEEVAKLGTRFTAGHRSDKDQEFQGGVLLPEYHRRIPADGLSVYAEGVWDQIVNNKDLDLPTQQELLAQFRCDEISREVLVSFDEVISPLEEKQAEGIRLGTPSVLPDLGAAGSRVREKCVTGFELQASRYHKGVYARKRAELESKIDTRLKALYQSQLSAAHKAGVAAFSDAVTNAVKAGQKSGGSYEFAEIVDKQKRKTLQIFQEEVESLVIPDVPWSKFEHQTSLFEKELGEVSARLRKDEMRRLATRVERWVRSRLGDAIGLEFNKLGSGRNGTGAPETGDKPPSEKDLWDRIWKVFVGIIKDAEERFADRAKSFEASQEEVDVGLWRLRRKSWVALREKIEEEVMEGNILLKLRENFEDKFRYDEAGVPRIWRPSDDIEGIYTRARESTLTLIPLLSRFRLSETYAPPDLPAFIGAVPAGAEVEDEEDLPPIGGLDEEDGKSLEEEMTVLSESKRQDLVVRFKKTADGVYVEAKRSAIGGITQVPLYFYAVLLVLGWNEIVMVLRNPILFLLLILFAGGGFVAYNLNLLGPMLQMANAATSQGLEIGKAKLRDFLENNETARQALAMPARGDTDSVSLDSLDSRGKKREQSIKKEDDDDDF